MKCGIPDNGTVLFQGDSITDAGRDYGNGDSMGSGYAMMASSLFSAMYPEKRIKFLNRGISGNRVNDLEERWKRDCLDLKPDCVSIMIGINDTWRAFDSNDPTSTESYERSYRYILDLTQKELGAVLVLIEPFVLPWPQDRRAWRSDLDPRIEIVHRLAQEYGAILVRMDRIMNEAADKREPSFWAEDGVHPTPAGHALIAISWLEQVTRRRCF
ncbi:MAG TPA: SGNH/GDSL hydrolase family protein [Alphaproteobacteria bacterium]|nr:SGNH/GDSL hydrolase family protein [Alphaproteobacteria bacterium]